MIASIISTESPWWFWVAMLVLAAIATGYKFSPFFPWLTRVDHQILNLLAERHVNNAWAKPYTSTVAKDVGRSEEKVARRLERLLSLGYVKREKNPPIWQITFEGLRRIGIVS